METNQTTRILVWRVFFNVASLQGPAAPWCIDQGPGSQRLWVKSFQIDCPSFSAMNQFGGHPRAWVQVEGELHLTPEGQAIFTHPLKTLEVILEEEEKYPIKNSDGSDSICSIRRFTQ